jgi:hypothetical protein
MSYLGNPVTSALLANAANGVTYSQLLSGTGSQTVFGLVNTPSGVVNTAVYINGLYQQKNTYSISGSQLTFSTAPISGTSNIEVITSQTLPIGTTSAGMVTFSPVGNLVSTDTQSAIAEVVSDLALSSGAAGVGFLQAGSGAVARTLQAKARDVVSVKDFGAVGDGVTDDTVAFVAAFTAIGTKGGTVSFLDKHLIDVNMTVPANITIRGSMSLVGSPKDNSSAPYGLMSALIVNSSATITLKGGAGLDGVLLYRKGMTFPANDSSAFSGVAVTAGGDDTFLVNSQVLGFAKAFYSNGYQRPRLKNVWFDCSNGVHIVSCADIAYIDSCHGWPFATIASGNGGAALQRSGSAFRFETMGDWNKISNCFAYAYSRGYYVTNCNSMTLHSCSADSTGSYAGQLGFVIDAGCEDSRLSLCQAAAQETGYFISTIANLHTRLIGCDSWACTNHGVLIGGGDVHILGGIHRQVPNGVTISTTTSRVFIDFTRFTNISGGYPVNPTVQTADLHIGDNCDYPSLAFGNAIVNNSFKVPKSIVAADPLNIPPETNFLQVTGNTNFGTINGGWSGRQVTLKFTGTPTVLDGGATIKLSGNFAATATSTLSLVHDGAVWCEVGRSIN